MYRTVRILSEAPIPARLHHCDISKTIHVPLLSFSVEAYDNADESRYTKYGGSGLSRSTQHRDPISNIIAYIVSCAEKERNR